MSQCCAQMRDALEFECDSHESPYECPDALISYLEKFDEYGIIVHDGGCASLAIAFCPFCGALARAKARSLV